MSFLVMPSERESGEIMGGGDWANEYSYKNPTTGKWEYSRSPRTYGDNGNMTYEEWMKKSYGWEPGTYGASASDNAYNNWLKSVTPEGKGRMNGIGEFIVGTKPNEATKSEASQLGSSEEVAANEDSHTSSEDKGTDFSWLTKATEETLDAKPDENSGDDGYDRGMYEYAFGLLHGNRKDDNGNDMGVFGTYDTLDKQLEASQKVIDKYEKNYGDKYDQETLKKNFKAYRDALEGIENINITKKTLSDYVEKYKSNYEKDENKGKRFFESDSKAGLSNVENARDAFRGAIVDYLDAEKAFTKALTKNNIDINEVSYEDVIKDVLDGNGDKYPEEVVNAAKATQAADHEAGYKEDLWKSAEKKYKEEASSISKNTKKEILEAVRSGKMTPFQAAVDLANLEVEAPELDFSASGVTIPMDEYGKKLSEGDVVTGATEFSGTVAKTPEAKKIETTVFETLSGIREELSKIDVSKVSTEEGAKEASDRITSLTVNAVEIANKTFVDTYKELVEAGVKAKDLASNPKVKQLSQEAFIIGQDIYEKASELEARTNDLGLGNLDKKYIKKHLDEVSIKVGQLDPESNKAVGSYYSPGSNMNGSSIQPTGINLSKEEVKALADYANDIQSTKDAAIAIMKSAAFNGAENVEGGRFTEEWKNAKALETGDFKEGAQEFVKDKGKLTWKDYFAAGAKGTLGTAVAILGGAVTAVNPVLGILLMTVGTASATKAGLQITTDVVRSKSTNQEMMFGSGEGGKDVFRDIYNRSLESANFGDAKSVGTYTSLGNGAISIVAGLVELIENPVVGVAAIRSGVEDINKAGKGGLSNNLDTAVNNIYNLGVDISTFLDRNDLKPEALGLTENLPTFIPNVKDKRIWNGDYTVYADDKNTATDPAAASEYGSAESSEELTEEEKAALDAAYSGAKEQAKNSNLATDYNAGMEQNVNEAVSDKYVKVFKVMLDKEPDYIRKVLIAIPKNHSEREW